MVKNLDIPNGAHDGENCGNASAGFGVRARCTVSVHGRPLGC
jgi:hypothetical protein